MACAELRPALDDGVPDARDIRQGPSLARRCPGPGLALSREVRY